MTEAQVKQLWSAAERSTGLTPVATVVVTDPDNKTITHQFDPRFGNRRLAQIDALGDKTSYGYDVGSFMNNVVDPNGNVTVTGHDVRGNVVSQTSCRALRDSGCSTSYYTYYPDATSTNLLPNPLNDVLLTVSDARSTSATDTRFRTTFAYDDAGNSTGITTAPVPGYPYGRTMSVSYSDTAGGCTAGTQAPAPPGLPCRSSTPGGATQTVLYNSRGDVEKLTDAVGLVTDLTYDGLGRVMSAASTSNAAPSG